jgi:hypothetical protein
MTTESQLLALHRELKKSYVNNGISQEAMILFDDIASDIFKDDFRSCPVCGNRLKKASQGWQCNDMYHGSPVIFIEGQKNCPHCENNGPYCRYQSYCLRKKFVGYGKPSMCVTGRIDLQSPEQ